MPESTALERRDPVAITAVLGTGDVEQLIDSAKTNVKYAIEVARKRGFVTDYEVKNKEGEITGYRAWYHLPLWQLIALPWGVTAFTEGDIKEVKPGEFQATAVAQVAETGTVIGRAVGSCAKSEPGKKWMSNQALMATAQSRAQRNALRSCFGAVLVAAGYDISDPDAPATTQQVGLLHQLAREIGWSEDQAHVEAGDISSFKDLNREQASEVIERWTALRDDVTGVGETALSGSAASHGEPERPSEREVPGAKVYGEGPGASRAPAKQLRICEHAEWEPVPKRPGLLKCKACGVGKKAR